ncbi:793_t:CDS:2, partial [Acaulospora colombiana]
LAPLANISHASSHHFVIQPIPSPSGPGVAPSAPRETQITSLPFIAFTDSTPVLRATPSGTLSVEMDVVRNLGVEMAFWVSVSLAFLEFLRDRDVSIFPTITPALAKPCLQRWAIRALRLFTVPLPGYETVHMRVELGDRVHLAKLRKHTLSFPVKIYHINL